MATVQPQVIKPEDKIKADAAAANSIPALRQAVMDLADELKRIKKELGIE